MAEKILVIDDDPETLKFLTLILSRQGYQVLTAKDGIQALDMAHSEHPGLIVLDVMMDTTTAGFQLALEIHSADPHSEFKEFRQVPIIMLTAIHSTTPLRFAPDQDYLPVQTFLEKPVEPEVLLAKVHELLGE